MIALPTDTTQLQIQVHALIACISLLQKSTTFFNRISLNILLLGSWNLDPADTVVLMSTLTAPARTSIYEVISPRRRVYTAAIPSFQVGTKSHADSVIVYAAFPTAVATKY
ncbi:hypothetical protein T4D_3958 [Trichinella pseudospiralis]|uniref:Uncharacterized protein n=1 Tax=Trichinella pseudospiralis TaxID=6337 RepID=A0A0V1FVP4_TRIPS|nr:hypothetical protein T4D_3958 [Trichinella pseudospiralis]